MTNEQLASMAILGVEDARVELWERTNKFFRTLVPVDRSGMNNADDWMQIAAEEFFLKLPKFDQSRHIKFLTFMGKVISNRFLRELKALNSQGRQTNAVTNHAEKIEDLEFMFAREYVSYSDDGMTEYFIRRFEEYVEREKADDPVFLKVFRAKRLMPDMTGKDLARLMSLHRMKVQSIFREIKEMAVQFGRVQKELVYGN